MMDEAADRIMAVMDAAFDPVFGEAWNRQQVRDALLTPRTNALLATADAVHPVARPGVPSEAAAGFLLSRAAPGEEELLLLAVNPDHRRRGIATALMERFKQDARTRGAGKIFLEMRVNNPARGFYEAHGFVPIGSRPNYYRQNNGTLLDAITFRYDMRK